MALAGFELEVILPESLALQPHTTVPTSYKHPQYTGPTRQLPSSLSTPDSLSKVCLYSSGLQNHCELLLFISRSEAGNNNDFRIFP